MLRSAALQALALTVASALFDAPARAQDSTAATPETDTPSAASDAEARGLFEAGRAAFSDGRFEDALGYFRRSHALSRRAELLYNIGSAADRLQRESEALEAFEAYLASVPEAPNRREVEGRVRALREHQARREAEERAAEEAAAEAAARERAAAAAIAPLDGESDRAAEGDDGGSNVAEEWWFWTIIGGVVVAGVVAGVLIGTSQSEVRYPPYRYGDDMAIAFTLTVPTP